MILPRNSAQTPEASAELMHRVRVLADATAELVEQGYVITEVDTHDWPYVIEVKPCRNCWKLPAEPLGIRSEGGLRFDVWLADIAGVKVAWKVPRADYRAPAVGHRDATTVGAWRA